MSKLKIKESGIFIKDLILLKINMGKKILLYLMKKYLKILKTHIVKMMMNDFNFNNFHIFKFIKICKNITIKNFFKNFIIFKVFFLFYHLLFQCYLLEQVLHLQFFQFSFQNEQVLSMRLKLQDQEFSIKFLLLLLI